MKSRASVERTNIEIDKKLMSQAMKATGLPTKRATIEEALRTVVRMKGQARALESLWGMGWEGNLDETREGRPVRPLRR